MTGTIKQDADGMSQAIQLLCNNALTDPDALMTGTDAYNVDESANKVRIAYSKYLG